MSAHTWWQAAPLAVALTPPGSICSDVGDEYVATQLLPQIGRNALVVATATALLAGVFQQGDDFAAPELVAAFEDDAQSFRPLQPLLVPPPVIADDGALPIEPTVVADDAAWMPSPPANEPPPRVPSRDVDEPAGSLFGGSDEDPGGPGASPVAASPRAWLPLGDSEDLALPAPAAPADDDSWALRVPGPPAPRLARLGDTEDIPAGALFGVPEDSTWWAPVVSELESASRLVLADDDWAPQPAPILATDGAAWMPAASGALLALPRPFPAADQDEIPPAPSVALEVDAPGLTPPSLMPGWSARLALDQDDTMQPAPPPVLVDGGDEWTPAQRAGRERSTIAFVLSVAVEEWAPVAAGSHGTINARAIVDAALGGATTDEARGGATVANAVGKAKIG